MDNTLLSFTIGHHDAKRPLPITAEAVASAHASGYDVLTSPITTAHFHSRVLTLLSQSYSDAKDSSLDITSSHNASPVVIPPLAPADSPLTPDGTISQTVGMTASWIDLGSPDPVIADISRQVLQLELTYAAFCGLTYIVIPGPRIRGNNPDGSDIMQFAHAILDALSLGPFMTVYIWLPMIDHAENEKEQMGDLALFARSQYLQDDEQSGKALDLFGTWQVWDMIRSVCKYSTRLCVALSIPRLLPPTSIQSRWYSEPVRILTIGAEVFVKNAKGYPVLSKAHQALIFRFVQGKQPAAWFLLCDVGPVPTTDARFETPDPTVFPTPAQASSTPHLKDQTPHLSYLRNLQNKAPPRSTADIFGAGYQDYLQAPLQPLTVNLESITYEVFEKDPVKYDWYERATSRALHDWVERGKPTSNPDGRVVVAVVGAGRGPLVTRAIQASEAVGVEIDMWALEKNPSAFVLLQRHNETTWNRKVNLVKSDMRTWRGPTRWDNPINVRKSFNMDPDEGQEVEQDPSQASHQEPRKGLQSIKIGSRGGHADNFSAGADDGPFPYKIDILISELLGSFADNELSPECLDGAQHLLNPVHGISIPSSYTAHITPIAAPKLHADISLSMVNSVPNAAEVPYVVMFNAIDYLSTDAVSTEQAPATTSPSNHKQTQSRAQPWASVAAKAAATAAATTSTATHQNRSSQTTDATNTATASGSGTLSTVPIIKQTWSFSHPNPYIPSLASTQPNPTTTLLHSPTNSHNARYSCHTFSVRNRGTCHGVAGYFEAVLYSGVELSTNPNTMSAKSEDMISWFPIFFPLKTPLYCPDDSVLSVQMWRRTDDRKVWYEWVVDVFISVGQQPQPQLQPHPPRRHETAGEKTDNDNDDNDYDDGRKRSTRRKIRVGGSELHSSEKEACLM